MVAIIHWFFNTAVLDTLRKFTCLINFNISPEINLISSKFINYCRIKLILFTAPYLITVSNKYIKSPGIIYVSLEIINSRETMRRIKKLYLIIKF